jgi:hypothetical protein
MKLLKLTLSLFALVLFSFSTVSCAENKKSESMSHQTEIKSSDGHDHGQMEANGAKSGQMDASSMDHSKMNTQKSEQTKLVITSYLQLKNALVADDNKEAAIAAKVLYGTLKGFDISGYSEKDQKELTDIIEDAAEHAEHISDSPIDHQREHLITLSEDLVDMIAIVGSDRTLYQANCGMYNDGKGAIWLSESKEIKNPFYGSKMLTCGTIQKEI